MSYRSHRELARCETRFQPYSYHTLERDRIKHTGPVMLIQNGRIMDELSDEETEWLAQGRAAFCNF